jgi:hypothetical protein
MENIRARKPKRDDRKDRKCYSGYSGKIENHYHFQYLRYETMMKYSFGPSLDLDRLNILSSGHLTFSDSILILGIYGKCMTQTKIMNPTIHTGKVWGMSQSIKKTYIKTCIYLIVEQCLSTINKFCTHFD